MIHSMLTKARAFKSEQSGAAMVEFAIAIPCLLLVLAIIIEGTRFAYAHQAAASGLRDATRYVARIAQENPCLAGQAAGNTQLQADFDGRVDDIVNFRFGTVNESVLPGGVTVTDVTPVLRCKAVDYSTTDISVVEITATLEYEFIFGGAFDFFNDRRDGFAFSISDQSRIFGL